MRAGNIGKIGKITAAALLLTTGLALSGCEDGYGYSGGLAVGYGDVWDPYYGGFAADPYWGWYGDYYYPGTGYYVYDRGNRRHRWNDSQRSYWQGRSQAWHNAHRDMRPVWRDYGGQRGGPRGGSHWQGSPGGAAPNGGAPGNGGSHQGGGSHHGGGGGHHGHH